MYDFIVEFNARKITRNDSPDKLRWGYSNTRNFNPREALTLVTESHNLELEAKLGKIWKGGSFLLAHA